MAAKALGVAAATLPVFGWPVVDSFRVALSHDVVSGTALNLQWLNMALLQHLGIGELSLDSAGGVVCRTVGVHENHLFVPAVWALHPQRLARFGARPTRRPQSARMPVCSFQGYGAILPRRRSDVGVHGIRQAKTPWRSVHERATRACA